MAGLLGDLDFCRASHRRKFHDTLRTAIRRIEEASALRPTNTAGFLFATPAFAVDDSSVRECLDLIRTVRLPRFCLTIDTEGALDEELVEAGIERSRAAGRKIAAQHSRLQRVLEIVGQARRELRTRRGEAVNSHKRGGPSARSDLKPAVSA